jgi:hypothetical protein
VGTSGMSVEPAWSVKCSVAREGQRCPAGVHGVTAPQDFVLHSWDNLVSNFVLVRNGFPRLRIERKLAMFIAVTYGRDVPIWFCLEQSVDCFIPVCTAIA